MAQRVLYVPAEVSESCARVAEMLFEYTITRELGYDGERMDKLFAPLGGDAPDISSSEPGEQPMLGDVTDALIQELRKAV
jgi:hypothetical protein